MLFFEFARVQVDAVFGVNPVAMLVQQPVNSVERATLLIGGQRKNQVAVRQIAFFFQADEIGNENGVAVLHVLGSAAVKVAVFLDEFEWIGGPILAVRFDDVKVPDEQDGLAISGSVKANDEILLPLVGTGDMDVPLSETRFEQTASHRFGGGGHIADGVRHIDLNELLENVARQLLCLIRTLRSSPERAARDQTEGQNPACSFPHLLSSERTITKKAVDLRVRQAAPRAHNEDIVTDTMRPRTTESCRARGPTPGTQQKRQISPRRFSPASSKARAGGYSQSGPIPAAT